MLIREGKRPGCRRSRSWDEPIRDGRQIHPRSSPIRRDLGQDLLAAGPGGAVHGAEPVDDFRICGSRRDLLGFGGTLIERLGRIVGYVTVCERHTTKLAACEHGFMGRCSVSNPRGAVTGFRVQNCASSLGPVLAWVAKFTAPATSAMNFSSGGGISSRAVRRSCPVW